MKELQTKNVEIPQTGISINQQTSVRSSLSVLNHFLLHENDIRKSINKPEVVLEYIVGLFDKGEAVIVENVKNFVQDNVCLLTNIAKANRCFRDILFALENEKGKKCIFPA